MSPAALLLVGTMLLAPSDTITVDDVREGYEGAFDVVTRVQPSGDTLAGVLVPRTLPKGNPLAGFQRDNRYVLTYLVGNAIGFAQSDVLAEGPVEERKRSFYQTLKADRRFNDTLLPWLAQYLEAHGTTLSGHQAAARDTIPFQMLRNVALHFFDVRGVSPDGSFKVAYCAKDAALADFPGDPPVEVAAFVYSVIRQDMNASEPAVRREFERAMEDLGELALSVDEEVKVAQAQGALWAHMAASRSLERALRRAYEQRALSLPFVVKLAAPAGE